MLSFCLGSSFGHLTEQLSEIMTKHMACVSRHPGERDSVEDLVVQWLAAIRDAAQR
ncbi:hypothetical protein JYK04_08108 [Streptomyces nojiriensis]|nr:hypothetical protein JYK04_08108 [Streptomyces nojiriensis]